MGGRSPIGRRGSAAPARNGGVLRSERTCTLRPLSAGGDRSPVSAQASTTFVLQYRFRPADSDCALLVPSPTTGGAHTAAQCESNCGEPLPVSHDLLLFAHPIVVGLVGSDDSWSAFGPFARRGPSPLADDIGLFAHYWRRLLHGCSLPTHQAPRGPWHRCRPHRLLDAETRCQQLGRLESTI